MLSAARARSCVRRTALTSPSRVLSSAKRPFSGWPYRRIPPTEPPIPLSEKCLLTLCGLAIIAAPLYNMGSIAVRCEMEELTGKYWVRDLEAGKGESTRPWMVVLRAYLMRSLGDAEKERRAVRDEVAVGEGRVVGEDEEVVVRARRVLGELSRGAGLEGREFELSVREGSGAMACIAVDGEHLVCDSGLLQLASNDAEVAAILGHALGHLLLHHERVAENHNALALYARHWLLQSQCMVFGGLVARFWLLARTRRAGAMSSLIVLGGLLRGLPSLMLWDIEARHPHLREDEARDVCMLLMSEAGYRLESNAEVWRKIAWEGAQRRANGGLLKATDWAIEHPEEYSQDDEVKYCEKIRSIAALATETSTSHVLKERPADLDEARVRAWKAFKTGGAVRRLAQVRQARQAASGGVSRDSAMMLLE